MCFSRKDARFHPAVPTLRCPKLCSGSRGPAMLARLANAIGGSAKDARWIARLAEGTASSASKPAMSQPPDAPLSKALKMMHAHGTDAINVSEGDGRLQGIITERDILLKYDFDDNFCTAPVGDLMTRWGGLITSPVPEPEPVPKPEPEPEPEPERSTPSPSPIAHSNFTSAVEVAEPSWSLARCLDVMLQKHCRHLPLLDNAATATGSSQGRADAVLSMRDICRFLTADESFPPDEASAALTLGDAIKDARHLWQPEVRRAEGSSGCSPCVPQAAALLAPSCNPACPKLRPRVIHAAALRAPGACRALGRRGRGGDACRRDGLCAGAARRAFAGVERAGLRPLHRARLAQGPRGAGVRPARWRAQSGLLVVPRCHSATAQRSTQPGPARTGPHGSRLRYALTGAAELLRSPRGARL